MKRYEYDERSHPCTGIYGWYVVCSIRLESKGGGFYAQERIGKDGKPFKLYKFRSMRTGADKGSLITVGGHDPRITKMGYFIRKYKIDELPQLWNVFIGDMSLVGPRAPYHRCFRPFVERSSSYGSQRHSLNDDDYAEKPYSFTRAFLSLQKEMEDLFSYVEPADNNKKAFSYKIQQLFIRVCITCLMTSKMRLTRIRHLELQVDLRI